MTQGLSRTHSHSARLIRVLADLAGAEKVGRVHIAEALSYRRRAPVN